MTYTVGKLAELSGVSARTLRYYDAVGLLCPGRMDENGYRVYGEAEVDRLQQILFYRELSVPLCEIAKILDAPGFDREKALASHLETLKEQAAHTARLIETVQKTLRAAKGEIVMSEKEKFDAFRQKMLDENEEKYGDELREKYGEETMGAFNKRMSKMTKEQWQNAEKLRESYETMLCDAYREGDPAGETAQKACALHKEWLLCFWKKEMYSPAAHQMMGETYVADERFLAYYDRLAKGLAPFFKAAIDCYCGVK